MGQRNTKSEEIQTNIGSPQGGAISGNFFNIAFEIALRKLRERLSEWRIEDEHSYANIIPRPPEEMIYADDADFLDIDKKRKNYLNNIVTDTLAEHNLKVNKDKTEHTIIK